MLISRGENVKLVALDKLTYAGNLANLEDLLDSNGPGAAESQSRCGESKNR